MKLIDGKIDLSRYAASPEFSCVVKPASVYCQEVIDKIYNPKQHEGSLLPWAHTHSKFAIRPGELTIWGGINGHKKSMLTSQIILACMAQSDKACIISLEMKPAETMKRMAYQAAACKPSISFIHEFAKWTDDKLWIYDHIGTINPERALALLRYTRQELNIQQIVIDSLMKCGIRQDDYSAQKDFIDKLQSHCKDTGQNVHLVAHMRKGESEKEQPDKFDVKGASEITDLVDNLFIVWDNKRKHEESKKQNPDQKIMEQPDLVLTCAKQRHGEWEGKIMLYFHESLNHVSQEGKNPACIFDFERYMQ